MTLKIVYPICCGIDVHKTFVVACIAATNKGVTTYKSHRFSTFTKGLKELSQWLCGNNCKDVCMESTGKYWIPVFNVLEDSCNITLAHPKYVKAIRGKKTDKKDAKWIADLFKHDLIAGSFMPPLAIRQLRDLMRYRFKLTNFMSSEKNRLQNSLTVSNIQLGNVVSLKNRRGHKKAIIAIARMLLTAIYNILKKKEPYNAELYRKSDVLPVTREITVEQAILLAKTQGYRIRAAS